MEIPRHWRLKDQRYKLTGYKITHSDGSVEYEFPPRSKPKILYDSNLLFLPNDKIVHSEVVRENQEQDNECQN